MNLQALFEEAWNRGTKCDTCHYLHTWQEHHPYGMGTAAETLGECALAEKEHPDLMECPYVEDAVREARAQEQASNEEVSLQTEDLSNQIEEAVRKVSEPSIQAEAPVDLPSGEKRLVMLTNFDDIQKEAPDDPLVAAAFLPEYKEALSIVYSQIPKEKWGTEEAQRLIFKVLDNLGER